MTTTVRRLDGRQLRLLPLIARGMTNVAIGRRLGIPPNTVKGYVQQPLARFGVDSREHLVAEAIRAGMLPIEPVKDVPEISDRDLRLISLMSEGLGSRALAEEFAVSPDSVRQFVNRLLARLHCHNRAHLMLRAFQLGVLKAPSTTTTNGALRG